MSTISSGNDSLSQRSNEVQQLIYERAYSLALSDPFMPQAIRENNNVAMWKVATREFAGKQTAQYFIKAIDRNYESAPSTKPKVLEFFHRMFGTLREGLGAMGKSADDANPFLHREIITPMTRLNAQCALDSLLELENALSQLQREWLQAREIEGSLEVDDKCFMPLQLQAGAFVALSALKQLCLDGNEIQAIQSGAFAALKQLQHLSLSYTQRASLEEGTFQGLEQLQELH